MASLGASQARTAQLIGSLGKATARRVLRIPATIPWTTSVRTLFGFNTPEQREPRYSIITSGVGTQSPTEADEVVARIPPSIELPSYALSGTPPTSPNEIPINTEEDIARARTACQLAKYLLDYSMDLVEPGITTKDIDDKTREECIKHGGYPSPLNYSKFPKSICTSVNNVVCHGIPDERPLEPTDIINVDISVFIEGFHGDTSRTLALENVDEYGHQLLDVGQRALEAGISVCGPSVPFSAIGGAINDFMQEESSGGFNICPDFVGHGIGRNFHAMPYIMHYTNYNHTPMYPGMIFTIEPAVNEYGGKMKILADNWTAVTVDNGRSCQFEHTILVTDSGYEQLT